MTSLWFHIVVIVAGCSAVTRAAAELMPSSVTPGSEAELGASCGSAAQMAAETAGGTLLETFALGTSPWRTTDPFLFLAYHRDHFPEGEGATLGPPPRYLRGRPIGSDFSGKDGWSMYHGERVPGFPAHPHRGFETITIVHRGVVDHFDGMGARGRYAGNDTQWMTAGRGVQHSEMFPLLDSHQPNPLDLFQVWLNLPRANKLTEPSYAMLWREHVPVVSLPGGATLRFIAGPSAYLALLGLGPGVSPPPPPPPSSYAAIDSADVLVWEVAIPTQTSATLPGSLHPASKRMIYFYEGDSIGVGGRQVSVGTGLAVVASEPLLVMAFGRPASLLVLQGRPIGEPVAQHGPFVMCTRDEIEQAFSDFRQNRFGGWPWADEAPTNEANSPRFATFPDGRIERPSPSL